MTPSEVLQGLIKVVVAGLDRWQEHKAEIEEAKRQVHSQAEADLIAVSAPVPARSSDTDLP